MSELADRVLRLDPGGTIGVQALSALVCDILAAAGMPPADAAVSAGLLAETQLYGIESHGVAHLPVYVRRLVEGGVAAAPQLAFERRGSAASVLDGGNGLGVLVAWRALEHACNLAREAGIGACAVRNSNHFGAAFPLVARAAQDGLVALAFSNAAPTMAPYGGREPVLGTNPLAAAFPCHDGPPIVIDMATSAASRGVIRRAARAGKPIPGDWALDEAGKPTTDAAAALKGTVQPLGGAKGYALTLMVELLCTTLAGGAGGFDVRNLNDDAVEPALVSHLFVALDPGKFAGADIGAAISTRLRDRIGNSARSGDEAPRMPGARAHASADRRRADGIPLSQELVASLRGAAEALPARQAGN